MEAGAHSMSRKELKKMLKEKYIEQINQEIAAKHNKTPTAELVSELVHELAEARAKLTLIAEFGDQTAGLYTSDCKT